MHHGYYRMTVGDLKQMIPVEARADPSLHSLLRAFSFLEGSDKKLRFRRQIFQHKVPNHFTRSVEWCIETLKTRSVENPRPYRYAVDAKSVEKEVAQGNIGWLVYRIHFVRLCHLLKTCNKP